jgi:hypothetical protein
MASIGAQAALLIGGIVQLLGALVALRWARKEKVASGTRAVCHA